MIKILLSVLHDLCFVGDVYNGTTPEDWGSFNGTTPESFLTLKPESACSACLQDRSKFVPSSRAPVAEAVVRHDISYAEKWTVLTPSLLAFAKDSGKAPGKWSTDKTNSNWQTVGRLEFQLFEDGFNRDNILLNNIINPFVEFRDPQTFRFSAIRALLGHMKTTGRNSGGLVFTMSEGSAKGE